MDNHILPQSRGHVVPTGRDEVSWGRQDLYSIGFWVKNHNVVERVSGLILEVAHLFAPEDVELTLVANGSVVETRIPELLG